MCVSLLIYIYETTVRQDELLFPQIQHQVKAHIHKTNKHIYRCLCCGGEAWSISLFLYTVLININNILLRYLYVPCTLRNSSASLVSSCKKFSRKRDDGKICLNACAHICVPVPYIERAPLFLIYKHNVSINILYVHCNSHINSTKWYRSFRYVPWMFAHVKLYPSIYICLRTELGL